MLTKQIYLTGSERQQLRGLLSKNGTLIGPVEEQLIITSLVFMSDWCNVSPRLLETQTVSENLRETLQLQLSWNQKNSLHIVIKKRRLEIGNLIIVTQDNCELLTTSVAQKQYNILHFVRHP